MSYVRMVARASRAWVLSQKARGLGLLSLFAWSPDWNRSIVGVLEERTARDPGHLLLYFEDRQYSYDQFNRIVNRHADAYRSLGIGQGDVVALMMTNRPEYLFHLYGLFKLGAVASLINPALNGRPLVHSVESCNPKLMVMGVRRIEQVQQVQTQWPGLEGKMYVVQEEGEDQSCGDYLPWEPVLEGKSEENPDSTQQVKMSDPAAYIYTSGTTGLPKAAIVKHHRFWRAGRGFGGIALALHDHDTVYICLPLYHANACAIGCSAAIMFGARIALARKFSASRFWDDIRRYQCSTFVYIGEVPRYLLNVPRRLNDAINPVRACTGNGLRIEIWDEFQERFDIRHISEFYAATEGNVETVNALGQRGAVGPYLPHKMKIARWDAEKEDFVRDAKGRLVKAKTGEAGVMLGKIKEKNEFAGYTDQSASEKKVIRDAFKQGDAWYNTGDLLRRGWLNELYFVDRLGDTYRWKGENVSTQEVATEINMLDWIDETTVYGVQVPGADGRAGMATIVPGPGREFDGAAFWNHIEALPVYQQPVFVRVRQALETTHTFKHDKKTLKDEGFDPTRVSDALYVRDPAARQYVPLTEEVYERIVSGRFVV